MKKILKLTVLTMLFLLGHWATAQIKINQSIGENSINASSAFMDASVTNTVNNKDWGKGLIFPRTDLTTLNLKNQGGLFSTSNNPNRFDGMIVYNVGIGKTPATNSGIGNQDVKEGFYYFENKGTANDFSTGTWKPMGGGTAAVNPKVNVINNTATATNLQFNGKDVMMQKGTFTTDGTSTSPTAYSAVVTTPTNSSVYRVTIYKAGTGSVYANSVYNYNIADGKLITGSPSMSVVYPAGTYDYTVEYILP